ncbi:MAG: family 16 glycoside hydrolase [Opitutaceae bacterium]
MKIPARLHLLAGLAVYALLLAAPLRAAELFDGKTLAGWEGDLKWWRVQDGALTGGSVTEKVPRNFFLATTRSFQNFELRLKLKLTGDPKTGMINSGVQIRSLRVPNDTEMSGYQVDAGDKWWGKLYDESRRRKVIAEPLDDAAVTAAIRAGDWNDYRILAEGPRLRSWINGVAALDYTETDPTVALDGKIAIQIHSGGIALVQAKDITLEDLPPTPGAPTWDKVGHPKPREPGAGKKNPAPKKAAESKPNPKVATAANTAGGGRDISYNAVNSDALSPEDERLSFQLPPGFEAELVVGETPGFGKFVGLAWDARMRLWSMTALEYPVDGNEQKAESDALFAAGGRDKVVVFDSPYAAPAPGRAAVTTSPRVFADGLVMPLGIQPYKDGVFVQYGADIRFYRDTNADGRADRHEVILTGFGTQDSHLFPHQFLRQPGGQLFVAQGLFNYSKVRRPDGRAFADGSTEVAFNQCKLGTFALDGSRFEALTAGPNNIWGLVTSREGETFFQEANDIGYPVIPYEPGVWVATGSKDRLRPYQPLMPPPLPPAQMGGTGLSGLALAEDRDGLFRRFGAPDADAGAKIFFLANPITNTINAVKATPDSGHYRFEKLPDFLTTADKWFRPVAIHFGPDGALYIVDWYNKIISHNEVPRAHPDRDKSRGRIWRIRHREQPRVTPSDLTQLDDRALLAKLGEANALVSRLAWLEIVDRKATALAPDLEKIVSDPTASIDRRLAALWALESLQPVPTALLQKLVADPATTLRHEAARLAAAHSRPEGEFVALATPLIADPSPSVRASIGDVLRRVPHAGPRVMSLAAGLGQASLTKGGDFERYEREFERYLARWAMELNPAATAAMLASPEGRALPLEGRLLATLSLGDKPAALGLAELAPQLNRPLSDEEVRTLAAQFAEPAARGALSSALGLPASRSSVLRALLGLRLSLDVTPLTSALTAAAKVLIADSNSVDVILGAQVAGAFKLSATEPELTAALARQPSTGATPVVIALLRALRENSAGPVMSFERRARESRDNTIRDEALAALAALRTPDSTHSLLRMLPALTPAQRGHALERLAVYPVGADAVAAALRAGDLAKADLGVSAAEKLHLLLPGDAIVSEIWARLGGDAQRALRLPGGPNNYADSQISLAGPFTIECWAKLDPQIDYQDGLLGGSGQLDLNFYSGQLLLWLSEANNMVMAKKKTLPDVWTHYAITRDRAGFFRIYFNGELEATSATTSQTVFTNLNVGRSRLNPSIGTTAGWLAEYRVWNVARSSEEIRSHFDRSFAGTLPAARPAGLVEIFAGASWGPLKGTAHVELTDDAPVLLTAAQAEQQEQKFSRFRVLANSRGNPEHGKQLFTTLCLACHQFAGQGGAIAPALDGVGNTGVEALLRHILTPSAAMESAYRMFRVVGTDGSVREGFLVEETRDFIVLRAPGAEDRRIPRGEIKKSSYLNRSLMPEGLLETMPAEHVSDLFAHLKSLR